MHGRQLDVFVLLKDATQVFVYFVFFFLQDAVRTHLFILVFGLNERGHSSC